MRSTTRALGLVAVAIIAVGGTVEPVAAQSACVAAKVTASAKRALCKALLEAAEARTNAPAKPSALARCTSAFDAAFAKADASGGCSTTGDAAEFAAKVEDFVAALASELDVTTPADPSKCESNKIKAAAKKASCRLRLVAAFTAKPHRPPAPFRAGKCDQAFAKTFARLDADSSCHTSDDADEIGALVDAFVEGIDDMTPIVESGCTPITPVALHGDDPFFGNSRLTPIKKGKVPCVHIETLKKATCAFRPDSGAWIETASGGYALLGQWIAKNGDPGGEYTVAAAIGEDLAVPCIEPTANDVSGTGTADALVHSCTFERFLSPRNGSGGKLVNHATQPVCSTSIPPPDQTVEGPMLVECLGEDPQACCYIGKGAGLNAANGTERDANNFYLQQFSSHCHVAVSSGVELYAAKRPATRLVLQPGSSAWEVDPFTPLVWRPVSPANIANY